jgi:molecular chaperone GrpE
MATQKTRREPSHEFQSAAEQSAEVPAAEAARSEGPVEASLPEQLEAALAERDANLDRALRAQAELENFRKRVRKEADEQAKYQSLRLCRDVLPVLDNLRRALDAAQNSHNVDELVQGVRMVLDQFETILAAHDVEAIEAVGQPFDPNLHEAIQHMPSDDHPAMTVIAEYRQGYRLHGRVVRPSQVIVSSGPASASSQAEPAGAGNPDDSAGESD